MYLVIEIYDRDFVQALPARDRNEASGIANRLLEDHCNTIGEPEAYKTYSGPKPPDDWPPQLHLDDPSDGESGAWANLKDMKWDAHVASIPDDIQTSMLDVLLKALCKKTMDAPDSDCGDGSCEDCAISTVLSIAAGDA